ncbi:hypothetical protein [Spongiimicrobium salis]
MKQIIYNLNQIHEIRPKNHKDIAHKILMFYENRTLYLKGLSAVGEYFT